MPATHLAPRHRAARSLAFLGLAVTTLTGARADPPAPRRAPLFERVVGQATGRNGYEELVQAAELVTGNAAWRAAEPKLRDLSLDERRKLLRERPLVEALRLLERGLEKPVVSVRTELDSFTALPEFSGFRSLGRLLGLRQYVELAEGRRTEALATLRTALRLGHAVQLDCVVAGTMGGALQSSALRSMAAHLGQLSAGDCERLYRICDELLQAPDPSPGLLAGELRSQQGGLEAVRRDPSRLGELLHEEEEDEEGRQRRELARSLQLLAATDRPAFDRLLDRTGELLQQHWTEQIGELARPPWERKGIDGETGTLEGRLAARMSDWVPSRAWLMERLSGPRTLLALMAVHAAIHRFRWEHERLPRSLEELGLGERAVDPFTGQPFRYTVEGPRYRLESAGWTADPDDGSAVQGRHPLSLLPEP